MERQCGFPVLPAAQAAWHRRRSIRNSAWSRSCLIARNIYLRPGAALHGFGLVDRAPCSKHDTQGPAGSVLHRARSCRTRLVALSVAQQQMVEIARALTQCCRASSSWTNPPLSCRWPSRRTSSAIMRRLRADAASSSCIVSHRLERSADALPIASTVFRDGRIHRHPPHARHDASPIIDRSS